MKNLTLIVFLTVLSFLNAQTVVTIPSTDNLKVTGKLYHLNNKAPVVLLCHQAGFNKSEYAEIALKLNDLGFNCLAIDLRSGGNAPEGYNVTNMTAKRMGLATKYINSKGDIESALYYLAEKYKQKIILWGSSYTASLALVIANSNANVNAVLAFSPGEYFKNGNFVKEGTKGLYKPCFITSSKSESNNNLQTIINGIEKDKLVHFTPIKEGEHGAKALWESKPDHVEYWNALLPFLKTLQ